MASLGASAGVAAATASQELFLQVRVNGEVMPPTLAQTQSDGSVSVRRSQLDAWRLTKRVPINALRNAESFVPLDALEGMVYVIDQANQTLVIDTAPSYFDVTLVTPGQRQAAEPDPAPLGGFFNYDLTMQSVDRRLLGGGLFEAVVFGPLGSFANTAVARTAPARSLVRLDSTWTIDRPNQRASWRIGDSISSAGSWSQPLRFGGVQYATNFSVQPGFNSLAAPGLAGVATLPSTIDLYINDALRMRSEVPAGPFDIPQLPIVTGAGEARLVVRDVLGRQQTFTTPFYASSQLLQDGLRDFSYEIGAVRERYGSASGGYGQLLAVATERRGLSNALTGELHAELSRTRQAIGLGSVWLWPAAGVVSASAAGSRRAASTASTEPARQGGLLAIGFQRQAERVSFGAEWVSTSQGFTSLHRSTTSTLDAPRTDGDFPEPRQQQRAHASYASRNCGSLGVDYTRRTYADRSTAGILGGSYGLALGAGHFSVTVLRDLHAGQTFASITFSRPMGREVNGSVNVTSQGSGPPASRWQAQRSLPAGDGYGYRLAATSGQTPRLDGGLQMQNDHGSFALDIAQSTGPAAWRVGAAGGMAMIGRDIFASRTISDSFSVVEVGGFADVRVFADNQLVGLTGADGTAIVPRLLAYQTTPVRIEQADLPLNATVGALDMVARPWFRSGVSLRFPVRRARGALLTVLLEDGSPVPAGATARLAGAELDQPVAGRGELYLTGLATTNQVVLRWDERQCVIAVELPETPDPLPQLGTIVCREVRR